MYKQLKLVVKIAFNIIIFAAVIPANAALKDNIKKAIETRAVVVETEMGNISKNMTAIFAHRSLAPAETLGGGLFGVAVGLDASYVDFNSDSLKTLLGGTISDSTYDINSIPLPKLSLAIGLPVIPVDVSLTYLPNITGYSYMSAALKYGIIEGGLALPAVSLTGNYSSAVLADSFDTTTMGIDLAISKGFGVGVKFIPYAGVGYITGTTKINSKVLPPQTNIKTSYDNSSNKIFLGAALELGIINLVGQFDKIGDYSAYGIRVGFKF